MAQPGLLLVVTMVSRGFAFIEKKREGARRRRRRRRRGDQQVEEVPRGERAERSKQGGVAWIGGMQVGGRI